MNKEAEDKLNQKLKKKAMKRIKSRGIDPKLILEADESTFRLWIVNEVLSMADAVNKLEEEC